MTNDEVIEVIRSADEYIVMKTQFGACYKPELVRALEIATKALEKEIPKLPIRKNLVWKCSECGKAFAEVDKAYCEHCGQKLDWRI